MFNITLLFKTEAWVIALVLFLAMMLSTWFGFRIGNYLHNRQKAKDIGSESASLTGLLFFLLAFTFGMSGSRYDTRRQVVIEEANDIGTAILRTDLYPAPERQLFRNDFKDYVEARISYYEAGSNLQKISQSDSLSQVISAKIWKRAAELSHDPANLAATQQMIPAINAMIDITTTRLAGERARVPESILYMLFVIAIVSAFYGGYSAGRKGVVDWLVEAGFCMLVAAVVLFTLDLDRPRRGMINLDTPNEAIVALRKSF